MFQICTFIGRANSLLVHVPDGHVGHVAIPIVSAPFTRADVAEACRAQGIDAVVIESCVGELGAAMKAARAAANSEQSRRAALQAQVMRGSIDPEERDRAKIIQRRQALSDSIGNAKLNISVMETAEKAGKKIDAHDLARLRRRLGALREEMLAIESVLSTMKKARAAQAETRQRELEGRFVVAAKAVLPREAFDSLLAMAREESDEDAD